MSKGILTGVMYLEIHIKIVPSLIVAQAIALGRLN
jgi:hypothetical protein